MHWIENVLFPPSSKAQPQDYPEPEVDEKSSLARKVAWVLFCGASLQLAFLQPSIILLPGERTNLFSGLFCALSLVATVWAAKKEELVRNRGEAAIYLLLVGLLLLSAITSILPGTNTLRVLVLISSGLGGFWGARVLLATPARQRSFLQLSLLMLAGILVVALISYAASGSIGKVLDANYHPLATKIMLLWFAPLTLFFWGRPRQIIIGGLFIALSYLLFSLTQLRSAMVLPLIMGLLAVFWGRLRLRYFLMILLAASIILFFFVRYLPSYKIGKEYEPAYYRVENIPLSWHIAKQHPWLGIGLLTPREEFLKDYDIKYPYVSREQFNDSLRNIKVADNMFLTFMAGVGFPFLLLYSFALIKLMRTLVRSIAAEPSSPPLIPPLAIFLPLAGALLSFFCYDILLHPQVCWFFHLLLGLISVNGATFTNAKKIPTT